MGVHIDPSGSDGEELSPLSEINVTPFIDVMLVLLIIFMVTAPMMTTGMKVDLPKAALTKPPDQAKPITVTIAADGQLQVDNLMVTSEQLVAAVNGARGGEDRPIHLRGDNATTYGTVVSVVDRLSAAGLSKFVLLFERRNPSTAASGSVP